MCGPRHEPERADEHDGVGLILRGERYEFARGLMDVFAAGKVLEREHGLEALEFVSPNSGLSPWH